MIKTSSVLNYFKPHRHEAIIRLRNSALGLLSIVIATLILPLPSPVTSLIIFATEGLRSGDLWHWLCNAELAIIALLSLNMLQAGYAIKYPRKPYAPLPSPMKGTVKSPPALQRSLKGLSPKITPHPQKSFSLSSSYASSPISTPSRVLSYSIPSTASPFNTSIASSVSVSSQTPGTPSPIIAAYRSRHASSVGRPVDGALLNRLVAEDFDDDD